MKIVFDCERMKYPYTGLYEYCHKLGNALQTTKLPEDRLTLYVPKNEIHSFNGGQEILVQRGIHKFVFPFIKSDISLWHTCHQTSSYIPPAARKLKKVMTIHDLNFMHEEKSEAKKASELKKHQACLNKVDHLVVISKFAENDVLNYLEVKKPITIIYNGCDIEKYPHFDQPIYRPKKEFIFAIGTVNAKKNFHVLPQLLVHNDYELVIAGNEDKHYVELIKAVAKQLNVAQRLHILGSIDQKNKYWYYKNCLAFAFPSLAEGFGIPVIEAMNFGKPVFISKLTSLPEIGGDCACYFDNFDAKTMQDTFENGMNNYLDTNPTDKILAHAKQFSWKTCGLLHWELYRSLLEL